MRQILDLFGPGFNNRKLFYRRKKTLFKKNRKKLDSVLQSSELLETLINSKFCKQKMNLFNQSG